MSITEDWQRALTVPCPFCRQPSGSRCTTPGGTAEGYAKQPHRGRLDAGSRFFRPPSSDSSYYLRIQEVEGNRSAGTAVLTKQDMVQIREFLTDRIANSGPCDVVSKITIALPEEFRPLITYRVVVLVDACDPHQARAMLRDYDVDDVEEYDEGYD